MKNGKRFITIAAMLVAATFTSLAAAATPGTYRGTTKDGLKVTVKIKKSGNSGSFHFCGSSLKFTLSSKGTFSVKDDEVAGSGKVKGQKVTGKVKPSGCSASGDSYTAELK